MTTLRTLRFRPQPDKLYTIELPGVGLFVRSGAWPGVRIFFDEQTENYEGERSEPVADCSTYVRPFKRAYVQFPSVVGPEVLVLEHMDCATLVLAPGSGCSPGTRVRYVARFNGVAVAEAATLTLVDTTQPSEREWGAHDDETFSTPDAYLGGMITATRASGASTYTVRLSAVHVKLDGTTVAIPVMQWVAAEFPAASGSFLTSLEFGGTRTFAAGITQGLPPCPKPAWKLELIAGAGTSFSDLYATIYTRSLG